MRGVSSASLTCGPPGDHPGDQPAAPIAAAAPRAPPAACPIGVAVGVPRVCVRSLMYVAWSSPSHPQLGPPSDASSSSI